MFSRPERCRSTKPLLGCGDMMILFSSTSMRSPLTIFMREAMRSSASKVSSSIRKFNWVANRMQRIMRNGSSEKVTSGSRGVAMMPSSRSAKPLKGSTNSPKRSWFRQMAMALMVKSRRFWSSSSVPSSTMGLRESWL